MSPRASAAPRPIVTALLALGLTAACGAPPPPAREAIINGVASGPEDDSAIGLAILTTRGAFMGECSGVLVAPNLVLTARHCVSTVQPGPVGCNEDGMALLGGALLGDYAPEQLAVITGARFKTTFDAKAVQVIRPESTNLCNQDISLVLLDHPLEGVPIAPLRLDEPPVPGETVTAVGWGLSNNTGSGFPSRRRRAGIPVIDVGPASNQLNGRGPVGPNEFSIGEGICEGDSGGPAYAERTGAVIGVVSRGGNGRSASDPPWASCVDDATHKAVNLYTRVDTLRDFILPAFAAAGAEPWFEGGPDPRKARLGESCASDDACRSNLCPDDLRACTQACDPENACPDGFSCRTTEGGGRCVRAGGCSAGGPGGPSGPGPALLALAALALTRGLLARRRQSSHREPAP